MIFSINLSPQKLSIFSHLKTLKFNSESPQFNFPSHGILRKMITIITGNFCEINFFLLLSTRKMSLFYLINASRKVMSLSFRLLLTINFSLLIMLKSFAEFSILSVPCVDEVVVRICCYYISRL